MEPRIPGAHVAQPLQDDPSAASAETGVALVDALWTSPTPIGFFDEECRLFRANDALAALVGLPPEAHVGRRLGELFPGPYGAVFARVEERMRLSLETRRTSAAEVTRDAPAAGPSRWRCTFHPVVAPSGTARHVCAIFADVLEERASSRSLIRARDDAERRASRLAVLQGVTASVSAARDLPEVARVVVESLARVVDASAAAVRLVGPDGALQDTAEAETPGAAVLFGADRSADAELPMALAARRGAPVWLESRAAIAERCAALRASGKGTVTACAALPLAVGDKVLGAVGLVFGVPRAFDPEEREFVLALADQCAQALEVALLRRAERRRATEMERARDRVAHLQSLTAALSGARTTDDVLRAIVAQAESTLGMDSAVALAVEPGGRRVARSAAMGVGASYLDALRTLGADAPSPEAWVARTGEGCWLESRDAIAGAFPRRDADLPGAPRLGTVGALPLRVRGEVVGAVAIGLVRQRRFHPDERQVLASAAAQCAQALERAGLYDSERRLRQEAERAKGVLDAIFDNAPIGIVIHDRDLRIVRVNRHFAQLTGLPVEAHHGKDLSDISPHAPDDIRNGIRRVIATGRPLLDVSVSGEMHADRGSVRHSINSWYPIVAGGEILGVGALVRDVTTEREAEQFQRNVLGIVGHDLRNPLAAIVTSLRMWQRSGTLASDAARRVERILANTGRLRRIIDVLLDYARVQGGRGVPLHRRACDLAAICREVGEECEAVHEGRRISIGGDGDVTGEWDPDRMAQVVANLVSNALEHSPPESEVEVAWRSAGDDVVLEVANEGQPIAPELLPRIFEPFRRAVAKPPRQGLGLGLFIASAIARAHGGRIEVRSRPGERTVFTLTLPRRG